MIRRCKDGREVAGREVGRERRFGVSWLVVWWLGGRWLGETSI